MDGILVIDKPAGITSHDVVNRARRVLGTKKVGHTGTLDPFATGVLVLVVGRATRLAQFLDKDAKSYEATMRFGSETDTGDNTGEATNVSELSPEDLAEKLNAVDWTAILDRFRGEIELTPPMYSAKKVAGKKLYELAREGKEIERKPIRVTIGSLDIIAPPADGSMRISVTCSAGTYVRTLAEDIGRSIGVPAHLTQLRRTAAGRFTLGDAVSLEALAEAADPERHRLAAETAVEHLQQFILDTDRVDKTRSGLSTRVREAPFTDGQSLRMLSPDGELIAIGEFRAAENDVKPKLVLV